MAEAARRTAYRFGWRAEGLCALALRLKGYRILARRFRSPFGEIDIVARRGTAVVFVEVKARTTRDSALEAIGPRQRARLERAAQAWLAARTSRIAPQSAPSLRFDVMVVAPWRWPRHIVNAWQVDAADLKRAGW